MSSLRPRTERKSASEAPRTSAGRPSRSQSPTRLAAHVYALAVEVDVAEVERNQLCRTEAAGVGELEQRCVAERERVGVATGAVDRALDLF